MKNTHITSLSIMLEFLSWIRVFRNWEASADLCDGGYAIDVRRDVPFAEFVAQSFAEVIAVVLHHVVLLRHKLRLQLIDRIVYLAHTLHTPNNLRFF